MRESIDKQLFLDALWKVARREGMTISEMEKELGYGRAHLTQLKHRASVSMNIFVKVVSYYNLNANYFFYEGEGLFREEEKSINEVLKVVRRIDRKL